MRHILAQYRQADLERAGQSIGMPAEDIRLFVDLAGAIGRPVVRFVSPKDGALEGCVRGCVWRTYVGAGTVVTDGKTDTFIAVNIPRGKQRSGSWIFQRTADASTIFHDGEVVSLDTAGSEKLIGELAACLG